MELGVQEGKTEHAVGEWVLSVELQVVGKVYPGFW